MTTASGTGMEFSARKREVIRRHAEFILELPDSSTVWSTSERLDGIQTIERCGRIRALVWDDILTVESAVIPDGGRTGDERQIYRVPKRVRAAAASVLVEGFTPCPCGHRGVRHRAEGYRCAYGRCDAVFSRDELDGGASA